MRSCWLVGILVFCCLFSTGFVSTAFAEDSGARFSDLSGEIDVRPQANEEDWKIAKLEMVLNVDDHVKTAEKSTAIISFADMTTFVMKPQSEIILSSSAAKDTQVKLLSGNLWVNVKKMMKDGSMDIEMSQAVAGIKGTNITCGSPNRDEDHIQVLRGLADVLIKESQQRILVSEGEELVVKKGQPPEKVQFDPQKVNDEWKDSLSNMGSSIDLKDIPETIQGILQGEASKFGALMDSFKALSAAAEITVEQQNEFHKSAWELFDMLPEDLLIFSSFRSKIDKAISGLPKLDQLKPNSGEKKKVEAQLSRANMLQKSVSSAIAKAQGYQREKEKLLKAKFNLKNNEEEVAAAQKALEDRIEKLGEIGKKLDSLFDDLNSAKDEFSTAYEPLSNAASEISAGPVQDEDWFGEQAEALIQVLSNLDRISQEITKILEAIPSIPDDSQLSSEVAGKLPDLIKASQQSSKEVTEKLSNLNKSCQKLASDIGKKKPEANKYLNDFGVAKVPGGTVSRLQDIADSLNSRVRLVNKGIESYDRSAPVTNPEKLKKSLEILRDFSSARRGYRDAQRIYENVMRSSSGQKYRTTQQTEVQDLFERISDTYQQVGIAAERLETALLDLQNQLGTFLTK